MHDQQGLTEMQLRWVASYFEAPTDGEVPANGDRSSTNESASEAAEDFLSGLSAEDRKKFDDRVKLEALEAYARLIGAKIAKNQIRADEAAEATKAHDGDAPRLVGGGAFVFDEPEIIPAIWGAGDRAYWVEGEGLLIYSDQGLGKTTTGQRLMLHLIGLKTGPLLGLPVRELSPSKKVLYLAMDRPRQASRSLRRMIQLEDRKILEDRVTFWKGPLPINPLVNPREFADWGQRVCPEVGVVVIDSIKDLAPGVAGDDVGAALNMSWQELIARGIDLLGLHHGRKAKQGTTRQMSLDEIYGSVWLTSGQGSVIGIDGEQGQEIVEFYHLKQPAEVVGPLTVRHDRATGAVELVQVIESLNQLVYERGDHGVTVAEAAAMVYRSSDNSFIQKMRRKLNGYAARELLDKIEGGRGEDGKKQHDRYVISTKLRWAVDHKETTVEDMFKDSGQKRAVT
jgi:replicative DNA helicase